MKYFLSKVKELISHVTTKNKLVNRVENLYLEVPYIQKDIAKNLGAKWDAAKRKWYIASNLDIEPFKQWLHLECKNQGEDEEEDDDENLRAEYFLFSSNK